MQKRVLSFLLALVLLFSCAPQTCFAKESVTEEVSVTQTEKAKHKKKKRAGKWVHKGHYYYFVNKNGRVKGKVKIGENYYLFNPKGAQLTGWQKLGKNYYFFNIGNRKRGYMLKSTVVNGIKLGKNGRAKVTAKNKKRLKVLAEATQIVQRAVKPDMKTRQKLRACFDYTIENYTYRGDPVFHSSKNWEVDYAWRMMTEFHGSCYEYGAMFAFVANACGCKECIAVSSGGHGWSEINGKVTDPSWEQIDTKHNYFQLNMELSGVDGRPNYLKYGYYKKII